jgi:hypothetical protein
MDARQVCQQIREQSLCKFIYHDFLSRHIRLGIDLDRKLQAAYDPDFGWYAWVVAGEFCGIGGKELDFYLRYGIFDYKGAA